MRSNTLDKVKELGGCLSIFEPIAGCTAKLNVADSVMPTPRHRNKMVKYIFCSINQLPTPITILSITKLCAKLPTKYLLINKMRISFGSCVNESGSVRPKTLKHRVLLGSQATLFVTCLTLCTTGLVQCIGILAVELRKWLFDFADRTYFSFHSINYRTKGNYSLG